MFISNSVRTQAGLTISHGPTELVWPVHINGGSIPNLINNQLIKCLVCLCYVKKIIALSLMRNADRSSFVSEQVLLTEKLKEKIPVLRNWHWCCTAKRMMNLSSTPTKPAKSRFLYKRSLLIKKLFRRGHRSDLLYLQSPIPCLWFLLSSAVLRFCDSYSFWLPIIENCWVSSRNINTLAENCCHLSGSWKVGGAVRLDKLESCGCGTVFSVGSVRLLWHHEDSCDPASVPSPGVLLQGRRFLQG